MKKLVALFALTIGLSTTALAETKTLKLHHYMAPQFHMTKEIVDVWSKDVMEASGGTLEIKNFAGMSLGGKPGMLPEQVQSGFVDIAFVIPGYTPGRFPSFEIFDVPFVGADPVTNAPKFWEMYENNPDIQKDLADFKVIGIGSIPAGEIMSTVPFEVSKLDGVKLRAASRASAEWLSEMNAVPVGMPLPAVGNAVAKHVVDGALIGYYTAGPMKFNELMPYGTKIDVDGKKFYALTYFTIMNKDVYESLTDEQKAAIDANSGLETSVKWAKILDTEYYNQVKLAEENGKKIVSITPEEEAMMVNAANTVLKKLTTELDEKGIDGNRLYEEFTK